MPDALPSDNKRTTIPTRFLEKIAPEIRDMAELQVMLAFFRIVAASDDAVDAISEESLYHDSPLQRALRLTGATRPPREEIQHGIDLALARDSLLRFVVSVPDDGEHAWLLHSSPENRLRLERYRNGGEPLSGLPRQRSGATIRVDRPNVFVMYEQNIGMVTPLIADQLIEAMELYPSRWIEEAIAEAVGYNRRNWRYVQRILQNWATEGRGNETARRHQSTSGSFDPNRLLQSEHAALFRRRR